MAKATLPVNFKDDILNAGMDGKRKFTITQNTDGTYSIEDVTEYDQIGSNFGSAQINATNTAVNASADASKIIDDLAAVAANTQKGYMAGALALKEVNQSLLFTNAASIDGSSFSYDLLNVTPSLNNTRFQKNAYFSKPVDDSAWKQECIPTSMQGKLWIGYRIVMKRNSIHILVEIHELYPVSGRIWSNFYNNGTWNGWRTITPQ